MRSCVPITRSCWISKKKIRKILNYENISKNFEFQSKNFETNPLLFHPTIKHIAASGTRMTLMNF